MDHGDGGDGPEDGARALRDRGDGVHGSDDGARVLRDGVRVCFTDRDLNSGVYRQAGCRLGLGPIRPVLPRCFPDLPDFRQG